MYGARSVAPPPKPSNVVSNPPNYNPNFHVVQTTAGPTTTEAGPQQSAPLASSSSYPGFGGAPMQAYQRPSPAKYPHQGSHHHRPTGGFVGGPDVAEGGTAYASSPYHQQPSSHVGAAGFSNQPPSSLAQQQPQQPYAPYNNAGMPAPGGGPGPRVNLGDAAAVAAATAAVLRGESAATTASILLDQQRQHFASRWTPGLAAFWEKLRSYFAVSHASVGLKLRATLFPWTKRRWQRSKLVHHSPHDTPTNNGAVAYALPADDPNAPDLYLPLVAFLTFALVTGYVKGHAGTFTSPEVLARIITSCAGFQLAELIVYSAGLAFSGAGGVPLLDLACYTGYKYVALCVNMVVGLLAGLSAYRVAVAYTALAASYFMLKTMAQTVPTKISAKAPVGREVIVCALGLLQGFSVWFLGYNRDLSSSSSSAVGVGSL